jgi:hypothetical protein
MLGHDVIPCKDGAGCDMVDVIQKGLNDSMIQQLMCMGHRDE